MALTRRLPAALPAALVAALLGGDVHAAAAPATAYEVPFPCGQTWTGSTRAGHSPSVHSVDWNRADDLGDAVVAAAPGVVKTAHATPSGGYGRWVVVDHGNGESSLYAHLEAVTVVVGQRVDQGSMLGTVGDSGNARGAHLHFEEKVGRSVVPAWFSGAASSHGARASANCVDVPVAGNFSGGPEAEVAVFRRSRRATFEVAGSQGEGALVAPRSVRFGGAVDEPVTGDWDGDGVTDLGTRTPRRSAFKLGTAQGLVKIRFGRSADRPVSGDWDGDGRSEIGVWRPETSTFWLRDAAGSSSAVALGTADDLPVTGDWDGDGRTDLGVYDPATATFTIRLVDAAGAVLLSSSVVGSPGDLPVTGDWDGDGTTDLGVWSPATATFLQGPGATPASPRGTSGTVSWGRPR